MGRALNAVLILLALALNGAMMLYWQIVLFPTEPTSAMATVGTTLLGVMFSFATGVVNYVVYKGCIVDD